MCDVIGQTIGIRFEAEAGEADGLRPFMDRYMITGARPVLPTVFGGVFFF